MTKLSSLRQHDAALKTGISFLRKMKLSRIPAHITSIELFVEFSSVMNRIKRESEEDLLNRKITSDTKVATFIQVLMSSAVFAWYANKTPEFVFFAIRALKFSLLHGYGPYSPTSYAVCGMVCGRLGKFERADQLGRIALKLSTRFEAANVDCFTQYFYYTCIYHLFNKCNDLNQRLAHLYTNGIQAATLPWACTSAGARVMCAWLEGNMRLDKFISLAARHRDEMISYNKQRVLPTIQIYRQLALNLAGRSAEPSKLQGEEIKDLEEFQKQAQDDPVTLRRIVMAGVELAYFFDHDLDEAEKYTRRSLKKWREDQPLYSSFFIPLHRGLVWCKLYARSPSSLYRRRARQEAKILQRWKKAGLVNPGLLLKLLEAEIMAFIEGGGGGARRKCLRLRKDGWETVKEAFDDAIHSLAEHGFQHLAAFGAERAAVYFLSSLNSGGGNADAADNVEKESFARTYLLDAVEGYQSWRALGKVDDLHQRYEAYLPPDILGKYQEVSFSSFLTYGGDSQM
eukprot:CAMPEP_0202456330 /NCGR_PEP_ID=MMETSP1360-20130828/13612_1 /ASSEMBLY_ACC=CAM_ASM_000848 /TAXON_ID=515479 /ORGANISM="Licmophora paradoxa, Strain CCMP2313" /LENGTH=512 /DNA_ID=CAMNT_0049076103 /DNA_START=31 /DNA_END=1569 /DNA_ORIENTATION=+